LIDRIHDVQPLPGREVVADAIRIPIDVIDAALAGAHAATAPAAVVRQFDAESSRIANGG